MHVTADDIISMLLVIGGIAALLLGQDAVGWALVGLGTGRVSKRAPKPEPEVKQ